MKTPKLLLAGLLAVSALAGTASAQTLIYIAGAPAFRQIGTTAVLDSLAATTTGGSAALSEAYSGTSGLYAANSVVIFGGTLSKGGTPVTVKITYSGSTAAVQSLAAGTSGTVGTTSFDVLYLKIGTNIPGGGTVSAPPAGTSVGSYLDPTSSANSASNFDPEFPNFGLIDTFQNTTPFHGTSTLTGTSITYSTLNEYGSANAIIPYKFVANSGAPIHNITTNLSQYLWTTGKLPLAFFSANINDETDGDYVYALGRDIASGSRYIHLAETGIGPANDITIRQYLATVSSGVISGYTVPPQVVINGVTSPSGNGGYSSFTPLLTALNATSTASVGYFVAYAGSPDADNALNKTTNPAVEVSWNGEFLGDGGSGNPGGTGSVAGTLEGTAPSNLAEGLYTFWSYIHVFYPTGLSTTNSAANTLAHAVYNDLGTDTATGAVLNSDVGVSRTVDGGKVTAIYF